VQDRYDEPPPKRRSGAFLVVLILLLCALAGLLFALGKVLTSDSGKSTTVKLQVPDNLIGKTQEEATTAIQTASPQFVVEVTTVKNDTVEKGKVVAVEPAQGSTVEVEKDARSVVTLTVSQGADTVKMPDVVGTPSCEEATALLTAAPFGFTNVLPCVEAPNPDPAVQVGQVTAQDPVKDADVAKDAPITLTISNGPPKVPIPAVAGQDAASAANALGQAGFQTTTQNEASDTVEKGKVIRTDPAEGTEAPKGSTVAIVVSSGKAQVAVPSVVSLTKAGADGAISSFGLVPQGQCQLDVTAPAAGVVTSQAIEAGTNVDPGTVVKYTYKSPDPGCT
jgi:serine/threonine-protein kinase